MNGQKKTHRSNEQNSTLHCSTRFLHFFGVVLHDFDVKRPQ